MEHLPENFKPLLWSYKFDAIDPQRDQKTIIEQAINYGDLEHWQWIKKRYGADGVRTILSSTPATTFRPQALKLAQIIFGVNIINNAPRGASN